MVVLQVLTHNVVVAREGKGEWVLKRNTEKLNSSTIWRVTVRQA